MTRARTLSALAFVAMLAAPANLTAQSQPQADDLRRRVEDVERQLFQQRLATPIGPQGQAIDQLRMRLDLLERQIASDRVSDSAAAIASRQKADAQPSSFEARLAEVEKQQAENETLIKDLQARISKLEKPVGRIVPLKKDR